MLLVPLGMRDRKTPPGRLLYAPHRRRRRPLFFSLTLSGDEMPHAARLSAKAHYPRRCLGIPCVPNERGARGTAVGPLFTIAHRPHPRDCQPRAWPPMHGPTQPCHSCSKHMYFACDFLHGDASRLQQHITLIDFMHATKIWFSPAPRMA